MVLECDCTYVRTELSYCLYMLSGQHGLAYDLHSTTYNITNKLWTAHHERAQLHTTDRACTCEQLDGMQQNKLKTKQEHYTYMDDKALNSDKPHADRVLGCASPLDRQAQATIWTQQ